MTASLALALCTLVQAPAPARPAGPDAGPVAGSPPAATTAAPPAELLGPDGWSGDPRFWSVEGDVLVGRSTPEVPCPTSSFLVHEGVFSDFDLTLEYQVEGGNSGVQFRSELVGERDVVGYQADLEDGPDWTGGVYEQGGRGVLARRATSLLVNGGLSDYDLLADPEDIRVAFQWWWKLDPRLTGLIQTSEFLKEILVCRDQSTAICIPNPS